MAKKVSSKSKHRDDKPAKADDTTVVLSLPAGLYRVYQGMTREERHAAMRLVYHLEGSTTTVWGMEYVTVRQKDHTKRDHDAGDADEPKKLCDGP